MSNFERVRTIHEMEDTHGKEGVLIRNNQTIYGKINALNNNSKGWSNLLFSEAIIYLELPKDLVNIERSLTLLRDGISHENYSVLFPTWSLSSTTRLYVRK